MSGDVVDFGAPRDDLLVGPFTVWHVSVEGRKIPRLTGHADGDKIALIVDGRFSFSFPLAEAHGAAWLIAQAMAVAEGYTHLGAEAKGGPFAPTLTRVDFTP